MALGDLRTFFRFVSVSFTTFQYSEHLLGGVLWRELCIVAFSDSNTVISTGPAGKIVFSSSAKEKEHFTLEEILSGPDE